MPDTSTEVAIATTTLGSAANTITFNSIPGTYTDLRLVVVCKSDDTTLGNNSIAVTMQFNSDTGTNYSITRISGNGSTATSIQFTGQTRIAMGSMPDSVTTNSNRALVTADIFSYAGSTNKTALVTNAHDLNTGDTTSQVRYTVGLWRSTSAITRIDVLCGTGNFVVGTTATLYGIL